MNSVSFCGQKTVIYGIEQAAKDLRNYELASANARGPRPILDRTAIAMHKASAEAYLDMATLDESFVDAIKNCDKNKAFLAQILKPENIGHINEINPFVIFKKIFLGMTTKNLQKEAYPAADEFISSIEKMI